MKVRGTRRILNIDEWKKAHLTLSSEFLAQIEGKDGYYFTRPWYHPCAFPSDHVPDWVRRRILQAMLEIAENWKKALFQAGFNYDVQIWIKNFDFINSEVFLVYGKEVEAWKTPLDSRHYFKDLPGLSNYDWSARHFIDWESESDWNLIHGSKPPRGRRAAKRKVTKRYFNDQINEKCVEFRRGLIWYGVRRSDRQS
jgi:hypothetical protein